MLLFLIYANFSEYAFHEWCTEKSYSNSFRFPSVSAYHNIHWQGYPFSRGRSNTAEKEPGHPQFFSVAYLAMAFRRAVKKK